MKTIITSFLLVILLSFNGLTHENCTSILETESEYCQNVPTISLNLFQKNNKRSLPSSLHKGLVLDLHQSALQQVLNESPLSLNINIPNPDGGMMALELVQTNPLAKNFKVTGSVSGEIPIQLGKYYEGKIKGLTTSIVTASFSDSGVRLLLSTKADGNMVIGKMNRLEKASTTYIFYKEKDLVNTPKFACQTPDFDPAFEIAPSTAASTDRSMMCIKPIDVYIECDFLMYQDFAGNVQNMTNYVVAIFHTTAALFRAEEVAIQTSEIFIWETEDPYTNDNADDALSDFKDHLNGDFNGRIAHLLSSYRDDTGFAGLGGLAYINTMCSPTFSVGYSNLQLDFEGQTLPAQSYDVVVMTHEIGHNLGPKHTHACVWGPNEDEALDDCYETEGDCPPGPTPVNGGTIMSYCHVTSSGINLSHGFGQEPGDKMRTQIANAAPVCLAVGTANFQAAVQPLSDPNIEEGGMVTLVAVPTSPDYYYQWYRNGEILPGIIFPTINVSGEGSYSVSIVHNGCTEVSAAIDVTVGTFEVSVACSPDCSVCVGQSILLETNINGATYAWSTGATSATIEVSNAGTYSVTVTDGSSSSVATTTVNFIQETRTDNPEICEGDTYTIGNSTYNTSGNYVDVINGNNNCTIEVMTNLTVLPTTEEINNVTICEGESYIVEGSIYTQTGNYTNETTNDDGCTHTILTNLMVLQAYAPQVEASICEGGSYIVGNSIYTQAGTYEDMLTATNGCDSTITTILTISDSYETSLNFSICEGETIIIDGMVYDQSTIFTIELMAQDGCDSLIHIDLEVYPMVETNIEMCADDSTSPGIYTTNLMSYLGCDSIVMLTVHPVEAPTFLSVGICTGESYDFFGEMLTTTGNYTHEEIDNNGCAVITHLDLMVEDEIMTEETIQLCYGGEYGGVMYTADADLSFQGENVNGCDSSAIIFIRVFDEIEIEAEFSNPSLGCDGDAGSVTLTVTGGSGDYTYLWSNGETGEIVENLGFGEQSVTVTDIAGCTAMQSWVIEGTNQLAVNYEATMIACHGDETGAIDMTIVSGTPPYNLFWSNGPIVEDLNELRAGTYTFFLNDANGCSLDTTIVITEPEMALMAETSSTNTTNEQEDGSATVVAAGGTSPYQYNWSNGAMTETIENLAAGVYTVEITDANGCTVTEEANVEQVLSYQNIVNVNDFAILPNPNTGLFSIQMNLAQSENIDVEIYNVIGQRVYYSSLSGREFHQTIDLQEPVSGVYVLVIKSDDWHFAERLVIAE